MAKILHFVFRDDDNTIYDEKCMYESKKNEIRFSCNNEKFKINYDKNKFILSKENDENIFILESKINNKLSYIFLKKQNVKVDVKVIYFDYINDTNYLEIKYILESDEKSVKRLIIRY